MFEENLRSIFSDDFGYTLIGARPASLDDSAGLCLESLYPEDRVNSFLRELFDRSDAFIFREIIGSRWLIHKKSLRNQIRKHDKLRLFIDFKFGNEGFFFYQLRHGELNLFDLLDCRAELIAIALGYGEENGRFYLRRLLVGEYLQRYPVVQAYPFDGLPFSDKIRDMGWLWCRDLESIDKPNASSNFSSLESEWEWIKKNEWDLTDISIPKPPHYISLPTYISCKSREAKMVHKRFVRARSKLARLFCSKKPSEVIAQEALKK